MNSTKSVMRPMNNNKNKLNSKKNGFLSQCQMHTLDTKWKSRYLNSFCAADYQIPNCTEVIIIWQNLGTVP